MIDKNEALFVVRLPFGQKTVPYADIPELIMQERGPRFDPDNANGAEFANFALRLWVEREQLNAAVKSGDVEVLHKSAHNRLSVGSLEDGVLTVRALRGYVESLHGYLEITDDPGQKAAPAASEGASDSKDPTPDPERRLARLRELGGTAKYSRGEWRFTGTRALLKSEESEERNRRSEKTIRADLRDAAQAERDATKDTAFNYGFGQLTR